MRQKYEVEAVAKGEELEMTKMKLAARNTEAEATVDNLNAKLVQIEKAKSKIQSSLSHVSSKADDVEVLVDVIHDLALKEGLSSIIHDLIAELGLSNVFSELLDSSTSSLLGAIQVNDLVSIVLGSSP